MKTHSESDPIQPGSLVSPKLDGVYARATKDGLYSKAGISIGTQPHLIERLKSHFQRHPQSELHGELYRHGAPLEHIVSDLKSGKGELDFHLHPTNQPKPRAGGNISHIHAARVRTQGEADEHYSAALNAGFEGQVIQTPDGELLKRKPLQDEEFQVTHAKHGKAHGILHVQDAQGRGFKVQAPSHVVKDNPIGMPATIAYNRKTEKGVPHAPIFKGLRYD